MAEFLSVLCKRASDRFIWIEVDMFGVGEEDVLKRMAFRQGLMLEEFTLLLISHIVLLRLEWHSRQWRDRCPSLLRRISCCRASYFEGKV